MRGLKTLLVCLCLTVGAAWSGETIRVLAANHAWVTGMKALIPDFERETGIKVNLESYYDDQLTQKVMVEFAAGGAEMDVFMTRPPQEAKLLERNGWAEDLLPYAAKDPGYDIDDYMPSSLQATRVNGVQTCIPVMQECHVLYYRKDLYEKHGLKPPKTFEELERNAKILTDRAAGTYGFTSRGQRNALITQFSSYLYGFGGDFFDEKSGKALIDTPEAAAAIDYYGRMLRLYAPDGVMNMGWMQAMANFQQGKTAMYADASTQYAMVMDPAQSPYGEVTGIAIFPAGPKAHKAYNITPWGLAISSASKKKDAAWKFVSYMTDKKRTTIIQGQYASTCSRMSVNDDPAGVASFSKEYSDVIRETAAFGVGYDRPLITAVQEARDIISEPVNVAIGGGDFAASAKRANQLFQELIDRERKEAQEK